VLWLDVYGVQPPEVWYVGKIFTSVLYIMYEWIQKLRELQDQVYKDGWGKYMFVAYWYFFRWLEIIS